MYPYRYYVAEIHMNEDIRVHHLVTVNGYRESLSVNSFLHGAKSSKVNDRRQIYWCDHHESQHKLRSTYPFSWPSLPNIEHGSVWEFYQYIGGNYKEKRFSEVPRRYLWVDEGQ
jgi:hypothetical protein